MVSSCDSFSFPRSLCEISMHHFSIHVNETEFTWILWNLVSRGREVWLLWRTSCSGDKQIHQAHPRPIQPNHFFWIISGRWSVQYLDIVHLLLMSILNILAQHGLTSKTIGMDLHMNAVWYCNFKTLYTSMDIGLLSHQISQWSVVEVLTLELTSRIKWHFPSK